MTINAITPLEYAVIQKLLFDETGIALGDNKTAMVEARLLKRLNHYQVKSYADYLKIVQLSKSELTEFINQMTTNETYFFREKEHFIFLDELSKKAQTLDVWSAASSQGAEAYSIAMTLEYNLKQNPWTVVATDINTRVLEMAQKGLYPFAWSEKICEEYRKKYCLKGKDRFEGKFLIDPALANRVVFLLNNLLFENKELGRFDVIFLRNVLLYFNDETKIKVIKNVLTNLKPDGYLITSMTETFNVKETPELKYLNNSIYQKAR